MSNNPFAPPKAALQSGGQDECWVDGKLVVAPLEATLPPRCVKCNAPVEGPMKPRKLYWHHPALALLILLSVPIYVIVALIVRKKAVVTFGLCETHRKRRLFGLIAVWGGLFGAVGAGIAASAAPDTLPWAIVGLSCGVAFIVGLVVSRTLTPARIDKEAVRLRGCCDEFRDSLGG